MTKMSDVLKAYRKRHKLTQDELAPVLGLSRTQLANIEGGRFLPSLPAFALICQVTNCNAKPILQEIAAKKVALRKRELKALLKALE